MALGKKGSLLSSSLLDTGEDDDPRTGLVNLADVMLVFACGLMVALIAHYNVELVPDQTSSADVGEIQKLEEELVAAEEGVAASDSMFSEVGTVYQDEETGDLYVVQPDSATSEDASAEEGE